MKCVQGPNENQFKLFGLRGFAKNFFLQKSEFSMEVGGWTTRIFFFF